VLEKLLCVKSARKVVVCEECCTLEYYSMHFGINIPTFQTSLLPSSSYECTLIEEVLCSRDITPQKTVCRHHHEYLKTPTKQLAKLLFCVSCFLMFGM